MRVLVATDGSAPAGIGCDLGRDIATRTAGCVRFIGVLPPTMELFGGPWPAAFVADPEPLERRALELLDGALDREVGRTPAGLAPTTVLRRGRPADQIAAEATHWKADVIVVGSRGHGALSSILVGSVAEEVVDRSHVPVLVARHPTLGRLIVAIDGSASADAAVTFVADALGHRGLEAAVVDVAPTPYPWWLGLGVADGDSYQALLEATEAICRQQQTAAHAAEQTLAAAGIDTVRAHRKGDAADELVRAADEAQADTIVLGSRGQTGIVRMLLGSVARQVLRHARQSVLIVHPPVVEVAPARAATPAPAELMKENPMKILLAYDGGEPAQRALLTAASIGKAMGAAVDVVSVVPVHPGRSPIDPWDDREVHDAELLDAKRRLEELGVPCRTYEPAGDPAVEIERIAAEGHYEMVIVGSRHQGTLGRFLQGSVSEHVATHTDATVVVAR